MAPAGALRRCGAGAAAPPEAAAAAPGPRARRRAGTPRSPWSRASARAAAALTAAALLLLAPAAPPQREAIALFGKSKRSRLRPKVLLTYRDYELRLVPRGEGKGLTAALPRLRLQKIPPKPVSLTSMSGSVEGSLGKELLTFPFTTQNAAAVQVGFPRISGRLRLSLEDPPVSLDVDEAVQTAEASYEQPVPGIGELGFRVKSNGEWGAGLTRQIEDLGRLHGNLNSQLDWSADLEKAYPAVKGVVPTITYGATQDGMRIRAKFDSFTEAGVRASYTVENVPGKYAPPDFLHEGQVALSTPSGRHTLEVQGHYDRRLPKLPVRGSLAYTARTRPVTLEASVDYDRYRLKARSKYAQVSAAVARKAELASGAGVGGRAAELELKVGKVSASTRLREGKPRVRLDLAL